MLTEALTACGAAHTSGAGSHGRASGLYGGFAKSHTTKETDHDRFNCTTNLSRARSN